jgi:hypothetical protein
MNHPSPVMPLEDTVTSLVSIYSGDVLTRTKLMKLLYLADWRFVRRVDVNASITGVRWLKYHYGPYNERIIDATERAHETGRIRILSGKTEYGRVYDHQPVSTDPEVTSHAEAIVTLDAVSAEFESVDTTHLVRAICNSPVVAEQEKYTPIPLQPSA